MLVAAPSLTLRRKATERKREREIVYNHMEYSILVKSSLAHCPSCPYLVAMGKNALLYDCKIKAGAGRAGNKASKYSKTDTRYILTRGQVNKYTTAIHGTYA